MAPQKWQKNIQNYKFIFLRLKNFADLCQKKPFAI
jgi:hypothetical protein